MKQPANAAAITAVIQCIQFGFSAICIVAGTSLSQAIGNGPLFSIFSGLMLVAMILLVLLVKSSTYVPFVFSQEVVTEQKVIEEETK